MLDPRTETNDAYEGPMNSTVATKVRATFALLLLGLTMYSGADALAKHALAQRVGLSTCGQADNPCELAPLTVTSYRSGRLVDADAADAAAAAPKVLGTVSTVPAPTAVPMAQS